MKYKRCDDVCSFFTVAEGKKAAPRRCILYACGVGAQGNPCTAIISDLSCVPVPFVIIADSSTRALWQLPADI
jgi:hypothetical protein